LGWAQRLLSVIPATLEVEIMRITFEVMQDKKLVRPYLKKKAGHGGASL
jgi:hypothetical protein